jgi:hypothetical protein
MNLANKVIDEDHNVVKHVMAPKMKADGFSKGYDPADHKRFADELSYKK